MGIKKIARPINKAKKEFVNWLKENDVECLDVYEGFTNDGFDYYSSVSGFIGESFYSVYFQIWEGELKIDYRDEENEYKGMSIYEFRELMNFNHPLKG